MSIKEGKMISANKKIGEYFYEHIQNAPWSLVP